MNRKSTHIVATLFQSHEFNAIFNYLQPVELRSDVRMEVICAVCELSDDKIPRLYREGTLMPFVRKMAHYSVSNTGKMRRKYFPIKVEHVPLVFTADDSIQMRERQQKERVQEALMLIINHVDHEEDLSILREYIKHGNMRAVAKENGRSLKYVFHHVNKGIGKIKRLIPPHLCLN